MQVIVLKEDLKFEILLALHQLLDSLLREILYWSTAKLWQLVQHQLNAPNFVLC